MTETFDGRVAGLSEDRQRLLKLLQAKRPTTPPPAATRPALGPVVRRDPNGPVPTSASQGQLWFLDQLNPGQPTYNIVLAETLSGWLDTGALRIALDMVSARHEALRTSLSEVDGDLQQVVRPPGRTELVIDDVSNLPEEERDEAARQIVTEHEVHRPFDLVKGPLFRARLIRLSPERHVFSCAAHHSVTDGWSFGIITRELSEFYNAVISEVIADQPEPLQFGDFAAWQQRYLDSPDMQDSLAYWASHLAGAATLELPTDRPRPAVASGRGAYYKTRLSTELRDRLRSVARERGASLFMLLVAGMNAVLSKYTGSDDIVLGTTASGRPQPEMEAIIGDFANMVVLRSVVTGDLTLGDLIERARGTILDAWQHQMVPFEQVVQKLAPVRDAGRNPLFQVAVQYLEATTSGGGLNLHGVQSHPVDLSLHRARFDMGISLVDDGRGFGMQIEYATDLFDESRVARLVQHFVSILELMASEPATRLSEVDLGASQREELLALATGPTSPVRTDGLHKLILDRARAQRDEPAIVDGPLRITYGELADRAFDLAARLRSQGVRPGDAVACAIDRTAAEIVAIVGVLQAGGVYVPVDPQSPENRLMKILASAEAKVLLIDSLDSPAAPSWNRLVVDVTEAVAQAEAQASPAGEAAYILFTSGSTGVPKGVVLPHDALMVYLEWMIEAGQMGPGTRTLHGVASTFDLAAGEILSTLISGGTVVVAPREVTLTPGGLARVIADEAVTHMFVTPSMLSLAGRGADSLRTIYIAGEVLLGELVQRWWRPGRRIINAYGPTEIGIACTAWDGDGSAPPGAVPIGRPLPNRVVHVIDRDGHLAPVGVRGEIVVGGHIASGYLADPELTKTRFVPDPVGGPQTYYRTGDLGFWTESGELSFVGRMDLQVKLRGLRIELGEIENALALHPQVALAAAAVVDEQLVAYVVANTGGAVDPAELRDIVAREVPAHMVPGRYSIVDALPMTTSGKIDRKRLPDLAIGEGVAQADFIEPRTRTERDVATVFQQILSTDRVGALDDFFRLGGHSLQAARLLNNIAETTGVTVAMRDLYARPTVEAIAKLIQTGGAGENTSTLASLRSDGSRPPLHLVHAVSGSPYSYSPLIRLLQDRPVGGFEAPGFDDAAVPLTTIQDMAIRYLADLRAAQPDGPYRLGGWSFGGFVAVEMAIRLREAGERVDSLILFDSNPPGPFEPPGELEIAEAWIRDLAGLAGMQPVGVGQLSGLDGDLLVDRLVELVLEAGYLSSDMQPELLRRRFRVFRADVLAMYSYEPRHYGGHMAIIGARQSGGLSEGWGAYAAEHSFVEVPGDHYSMWAPENLPAVAAAVEAAL